MASSEVSMEEAGPSGKCIKDSERFEAFNCAIENYVSSCFENQRLVNALARSFKPVYRKHKEEFTKKANEVEHTVFAKVKGDINSEIKKFAIAEKLQELDKIQKESDKEKIAWRPSGVPENDLRAYLCAAKTQHLLQHEEQVNFEYESLQKEFEDKLKKYKEKKEALTSKNAEMESLVENYRSQIETLTEHLPPETVVDLPEN